MSELAMGTGEGGTQSKATKSYSSLQVGIAFLL